VQDSERAPWISMEDTVFSDDDSTEVTTVTAAAARYVVQCCTTQSALALVNFVCQSSVNFLLNYTKG